MKKLVGILALLFAVIAVSAQTQYGYVKTKGRMDANGKLIPGQGLKGATVQVQGRTPILVNTDDGRFSFPTVHNQFRPIWMHVREPTAIQKILFM